MRYYNLRRNWTKKIEPHLEDAKLNEILVRDFRKYTVGRWGQEFVLGNVPRDFESCDWSFDHHSYLYHGPEPRFWSYVKHSACHWIVNFTLHLAQLAEPKKKWRIISSDGHSTVWDGRQTIFDFNFYAFGIPAIETFETAITHGEELCVGEELEVNYAEHYSVEQKSRKRKALIAKTENLGEEETS